MGRLGPDRLARGCVAGQLAGAGLRGVEQQRSGAAAGELGVDVAVHQHPGAAEPVDVNDTRDPAVVDGDPGVALEIEVVPLLAELGRGPVGVVVDGAVARLDEREHLVEVGRRVGAPDLHGCTGSRRRSILVLRDD